MTTIQYRVAVTKSNERVEGPDGADVVVTIPLADCALDPTVAYMRGRLKSTGPTGPLLAALRNGEAGTVLQRLAAQS